MIECPPNEGKVEVIILSNSINENKIYLKCLKCEHADGAKKLSVEGKPKKKQKLIKYVNKIIETNPDKQ